MSVVNKLKLQKLKIQYQNKGFFGLLLFITQKIVMHLPFVGRIVHAYILSYLRRHYDYVIQRYKDYAPPPISIMAYLNTAA